MKSKYAKFLEQAAKFRAQVLRECHAGTRQAEVARKYKVSRARVNQIIKGEAKLYETVLYSLR